MNQFYAKDFIETAEGLLFAVVKSGVEQGRVLCFLRYIYLNNEWKKVATTEANQWLKQNHPEYLHYSNAIDAFLHAVDMGRIVRHYQPKQRLWELLDLPCIKNLADLDGATRDLISLCQLLQRADLDIDQIGVTGSLLIGTQNTDSDLDLVFYQRSAFQQARKIIAAFIAEGQCQALTRQDWQESFARRDCALSFADYVWHEQRKFNKGLINQRKFDLSLVIEHVEPEDIYHKVGMMTLTTLVTNDERSFDYPAEFLIDHQEIYSIVCFTATYSGQAQTGEWIEVAGQLEVSDSGCKRIVVGSNREARGEYIKVLR
jgi:predicted nucleotidyltransferase